MWLSMALQKTYFKYRVNLSHVCSSKDGAFTTFDICLKSPENIHHLKEIATELNYIITDAWIHLISEVWEVLWALNAGAY